MRYLGGPLRLSVNAFLLIESQRSVLIDTSASNTLHSSLRRDGQLPGVGIELCHLTAQPFKQAARTRGISLNNSCTRCGLRGTKEAWHERTCTDLWPGVGGW
jgi:hypothetical protein